MATDFAVFLRRFLTTYLAGLRGCSPNTIASYRDTFKLLIAYFRDEQVHPAGASSPSSCIDAAAITGFLDWLEPAGDNSAVDAQPTPGRDQLVLRLDADRRTRPGWPAAKTSSRSPPSKHDRPAVAHLTVEQTRRLLAHPTGPPAAADATRPCSPPSTTPPPGSKNSPT